MVIKQTSLSRLKKNKLFLSVVVVVLAHVLAFAAQFVLILLIPSWPPSSVVQQFPFNVIDTISGVVFLPYMYFRRGLPYTILLVFGGQICLVYLLLCLAQLGTRVVRKIRGNHRQAKQ